MSRLRGQRVLVTGAAGFIGSHLVERLVREGCRVRALAHYRGDRTTPNLDEMDADIRGEIEVVWGDVVDRDSVQQAMRGVDVVFHLAALIGIPYSYHSPSSYIQTNVVGTLNLLQAAREVCVERFVHTSTSETYGSAQYVPMDEQHPLVAQSPYAASKIAADKLAESFYCSFELPVVTLRPFNVYGPRQSERAVIPTIIAQCLHGIDAIELGDPTPVRDFTFVTDTVEGFVRAASAAGAVGQVIQLGNGKGIAIGDLAERIASTFDREIRVDTNPARVRPSGSEVRELICSSAKAKSLLGWEPVVDLNAGLIRTVEWMRSRTERLAPHTYVV